MDSSFFYKVLSVIHRTQSITMAAEILGYTQSGLSHAVSRFEKELGFSLLIRDKKKNGVTLTKEALTLLPIAEEISAQLDKMNAAIRAIKAAEEKTLTIGTFASVVKQAFPEIIAVFSKRYPNVRLEIKKGSVEEIQTWIRTGVIDLAITSLQPNDAFDYIKLIDEPMCAVVPKSYEKPVFEIQDINNYSFIMPVNGNSTEDSDIKKIFIDNYLTPKTHLRITEWSTIPKLVGIDLGISILPTLMVRGLTENAVYLHIDPPCFRELIVVYTSSGHIPDPVQVFAECAKNILSNGHLFTLNH